MDGLILNGSMDAYISEEFHVIVDYCDQSFLDTYYADEGLICKSQSEIDAMMYAIQT